MNLKTFSKLLQSPQVKTSSGELPAVFRWTLGNHSADSRQAPRLHDLFLASSNELLRQAPIFLGELRELPTNLRTSVELSNSQQILRAWLRHFVSLYVFIVIIVNPAQQNKTSIETINPKQLTKLSGMSLVPRRFVRFFGASSSPAAYCPIGQLTPQLRYPWHNTRSSWPDARVHGPKPSVDTSTDPPARRPIFWHVPSAQHDFPALIVSSWSKHPASLKTQIKS